MRKVIGLIFLLVGALFALAPASSKFYRDREPYQVRRFQNTGWCMAAVGAVLFFL